MKRERLTEKQSIGVLKESEAGTKTENICPRLAISSATIYSRRKVHDGKGVGDADTRFCMP